MILWQSQEGQGEPDVGWSSRWRYSADPLLILPGNLKILIWLHFPGYLIKESDCVVKTPSITAGSRQKFIIDHMECGKTTFGITQQVR